MRRLRSSVQLDEERRTNAGFTEKTLNATQDGVVPIVSYSNYTMITNQLLLSQRIYVDFHHRIQKQKHVQITSNYIVGR